MNTKNFVCRLAAKILAFFLVFQGWLFWEPNREHTCDFMSRDANPPASASVAGLAFAGKKPKNDQVADNDHDGMPDDWESANGLDPEVFDGHDDPDGDGYSNYMEWKYGNDPADRNSFPGRSVHAVPEEYATIRDAIDAARSDGGGIVEISEGVYEETIKIYDGVRVVGCGDPARTVIVGDGKGNVVVMYGDNSGISGVTVRNSGENGNFAGISCTGNEKPEVFNCVVTGNNHGIRYGGDAAPLIFNNTVAGNTGNGIFSNGNAPGKVANNIVAGNGGAGVAGNGRAPAMLLNNNVWNNAADYEGCDPGEEDISEDPLFSDPEAGDFSLSPDSPCINSGVSGSEAGAFGPRLVATETFVNNRTVAIRIEGPETVDEKTSAQYICHSEHADGSAAAATPLWSVDCQDLVAVSPEGLVAAGEVSEDTVCSLNADYREYGSSWTATFEITVANIPVVTGIRVEGPGSLDENTSAGCVCLADYDDGSSEEIVPDRWTVECADISNITPDGLLTVSETAADLICSVTAVHTAADGTEHEASLFFAVNDTTDSDSDGLTDSRESNVYGTERNDSDTDDDGIRDGDELEFAGADWSDDSDGDGLNRLQDFDSNNNGVGDGLEDTDGDGISDYSEHALEIPEDVSPATVTQYRYNKQSEIVRAWSVVSRETP